MACPSGCAIVALCRCSMGLRDRFVIAGLRLAVYAGSDGELAERAGRVLRLRK